jgi:hypothetical protein
VEAVSYQVVARFDCKMTLGFEPTSGRFLFDDGTAQHFSACIFESHMWHHAMVSIDASGVGQLYVDGGAVSLASVAADGTTFTPNGLKTFTTVRPSVINDVPVHKTHCAKVKKVRSTSNAKLLDSPGRTCALVLGTLSFGTPFERSSNCLER